MRKYLLLVILSLLALSAIPQTDIVSCSSPSARTRCNDGTCSTSTGRGTCSGHGGVDGPVTNTNTEFIPFDPTDTPEPAEPAPVEPTPAEPQEEPVPESTPVVEPAPQEPSVPNDPAAPAPEPDTIPDSGGILDSGSSTPFVAGLLLLIALALGSMRSDKSRMK